MNFYIYGHEGNSAEMLANVQRFVGTAELEAAIYEFDQSEKRENHHFDLTPALFLDDRLLIEGDTPAYDETSMLISVAIQLYGYQGAGCCGGGCGCGGNSSAEQYGEDEEYSSACGCSDLCCDDDCSCK